METKAEDCDKTLVQEKKVHVKEDGYRAAHEPPSH